MTRSVIKSVVFAVVLLTVVSLVPAEDVEKKWRVSLGAWGYNPVDEIDSNHANFLILRDEEFDPVAFYEDPRNDSAAFGNLDIQSGLLVTAAVQYAVTKLFIVEGSVGYVKHNLGDVAVDIQFLGNPPPIPEITYNFTSYRVSAGDVERVPIQLTGLFRFRPRAKFNPYFGLGIGYSINTYTTVDEFDELSYNMDAATGTPMKVTSSLQTDGTLLAVGPALNLTGASVDVRDSFEWHAVAGAELTFKRKWSVFGDLRWVDHSRDFTVGFNGTEELGVSVVQYEDFANSDLGREYILGRGAGPVRITQGGLLDAGQSVNVRREGVGSDIICPEVPTPNDPLCEVIWFFKEDYDDPRLGDDFVPNGELDPGFHYVQGGSVSYDGFSFLIGVRYTF